MVRVFSWFLNLTYLAVLAVFSPLIVWQAIRTGKYREGLRGEVPRPSAAARRRRATASGFMPSASAK